MYKRQGTPRDPGAPTVDKIETTQGTEELNSKSNTQRGDNTGVSESRVPSESGALPTTEASKTLKAGETKAVAATLPPKDEKPTVIVVPASMGESAIQQDTVPVDRDEQKEAGARHVNDNDSSLVQMPSDLVSDTENGQGSSSVRHNMAISENDVLVMKSTPESLEPGPDTTVPMEVESNEPAMEVESNEPATTKKRLRDSGDEEDHVQPEGLEPNQKKSRMVSSESVDHVEPSTLAAPALEKAAAKPTQPEEKPVQRCNIDKIKMLIFSTGGLAHRGRGFERIFAEYWDALSLIVTGGRNRDEMAQLRSVVSSFLKTKRLKKLHNRLIMGT